MGLCWFRMVLVAVCFVAGVAAADTTVQVFSGNGGRNTRPFTVENHWEVQWLGSGSLFQLFLHDADGNLKGLVANQSGPGKGASYWAQGGKYYLQVNALGEWNLEVVQIPVNKKDAVAEAIPSSGLAIEGSGARNTRPFKVADSWEIQWESQGNLLQIFVNDDSGVLVALAANQQGAGPGSSYMAKGGQYHLSINALGEWKLRIAQVK